MTAGTRAALVQAFEEVKQVAESMLSGAPKESESQQSSGGCKEARRRPGPEKPFQKDRGRERIFAFDLLLKLHDLSRSVLGRIDEKGPNTTANRAQLDEICRQPVETSSAFFTDKRMKSFSRFSAGPRTDWQRTKPNSIIPLPGACACPCQPWSSRSRPRERPPAFQNPENVRTFKSLRAVEF